MVSKALIIQVDYNVLYNDKMFTRQLSMVEAEFREGYSALVGPK
jgi:hypothetical protein